jgi:F-type H+-transporting ATPase subunit delta
MRDRKAAVRFARAFFAEAGQRDAVQQAGRDLAALGAIARQVPELTGFLAHPLVPAEAKKQLCREHLGQVIAPGQMAFLDLLIDRERVALLPDIIECFQALVDDHARVIRAEVWSAAPLTDQERERLGRAIAAAFGGEPVLEVQVRAELIGGMRVRVRDTVVDGSIRTSLRVLAADLKAGPLPGAAGGESPAD